MDNQPGRTKSKGITRSIVLPFMDPLLTGAGRLSDATQAGVVFAYKKVGVAGTGVKIAKLAGAAADRAARAALGGGPLKNGGLGIAGGNARLGKVGQAVGVSVVVAVVAGGMIIDYIASRAPVQDALRNTCENCQEEFPDAAHPDGAVSETDASCPRCGQRKTDQA